MTKAEYGKKWREAHPDYYTKYRETHKEEISESRKYYYKKNRDKFKTRATKYYSTHREECLARNREYYERVKNTPEFKERANKRSKEWVENNRDLYNQRQRARYQRKKEKAVNAV